MFSFIWMQMTAPMKNEMSSTIPIELMPSCSISFTYCFQNIRKRSGTLNVRPISMRNWPNIVSHRCRIFIISGTKVVQIERNTKKKTIFFFYFRDAAYLLQGRKLQISAQNAKLFLFFHRKVLPLHPLITLTLHFDSFMNTIFIVLPILTLLMFDLGLALRPADFRLSRRICGFSRFALIFQIATKSGQKFNVFKA